MGSGSGLFLAADPQASGASSTCTRPANYSADRESAYTLWQLYFPSFVAEDDWLQTETLNARPKRKIGDNHDLWQEIRFKESPLSQEVDVGAQSGSAQSTRTKLGNGARTGIAPGEGPSTQG